MGTIFEALQNANCNLNKNSNILGVFLAKEQLNNAVTLLEKGYRLYDDIIQPIEKYGNVENVPEKK